MTTCTMWCGHEERRRLQAALTAGEPTLSALLATCRSIADDGADRRQPGLNPAGQRAFTDLFEYIGAAAVVHVLTGEAVSAERAALASICYSMARCGSGLRRRRARHLAAWPGSWPVLLATGARRLDAGPQTMPGALNQAS